MKPTNRNHTNRARRGFALVVTLSLMILLTLIAVGLLTLSAVSLRASSQGQAAAEARANARLALMMAIGELQKEMGPDSRISAPHDAGSAATGGQPRWTAVYDAWKYEAPGTPESPASRNPKFRGWLVSGANQVTGGPAGTGENVTLAGSTSADGQVEVPMHAVSSGKQRGRLAWWTADEGMKAKINAGPDDYASSTVASNPLFQAQSPSHLDQRQIPKLENFTWKPGERAKAISTPQVNLAANLTGGAGVGNLNHNLTVHSAGVLADVRGGHLKRDLTNLLTRPIAEVENKPLYLADGRMNRFAITREGAVSNVPGMPPLSDPKSSWEINLEELYLFHNLHREIDWSTGKPRLVNPNTKEKLVEDRFFIYKQPVFEAVHIIVSFKAVPDGGQGKYKMQGMLDAMIAISNPNDVPVVWSPDMALGVDMHSLPYYVEWNIRRADGTTKNTQTTGDINNPFFQSNIKGGFTIEPGEAAVFGSSEADTAARNCNLQRGFKPSGGVPIRDQDWGGGNKKGLRAGDLQPDDVIDYTFKKTGGTNNSNSSWVLLGRHIQNKSGGEWGISRVALGGGGGSITGEFWDQYMLKEFRPAERLAVSEYIGKPRPVMLLTFMPNVEKSRDPGAYLLPVPLNAFPSRSFQLREAAFGDAGIASLAPEETFHSTQWMVLCEPMDFTYGSPNILPKGDGGKNLYHGGARQLEDGGSFHVVRRRVPLAPPLSIGAFENAIAFGLNSRFRNTSGIGQGSALYRKWGGMPAMAKTIGNSWSTPFLAPDSVYDGNYHDASWMVNTALWDSWFLSGIVDGGATASSAWGGDPRSPSRQFKEFAESSAPLRNTRFSFYPLKSTDAALEELFDNENFKPAAINTLARYLLVDGAFNVNSTSVDAWKAFLASVREQSLLDADGVPQKKQNPYGTLGHAVSQATSGTEGEWKGFRDLSEQDIDGLAKAIVTEVKDRGPFLSMADFINRRPNSSDTGHQALGVLQTAIDMAGLNNAFTGDKRSVAAADFTPFPGGTVDAEPVRARALGSAGFLSQGALLTALGPQITVRSDTFLIRTYGDSRDSSGNILAKAWCEAVVQRAPEYVDPNDQPEAYDGWPGSSDKLSPANSLFGRRMQIKSFRWLSHDEIGDVNV